MFFRHPLQCQKNYLISCNITGIWPLILLSVWSCFPSVSSEICSCSRGNYIFHFTDIRQNSTSLPRHLSGTYAHFRCLSNEMTFYFALWNSLNRAKMSKVLMYLPFCPMRLSSPCCAYLESVQQSYQDIQNHLCSIPNQVSVEIQKCHAKPLKG